MEELVVDYGLHRTVYNLNETIVLDGEATELLLLVVLITVKPATCMFILILLSVRSKINCRSSTTEHLCLDDCLFLQLIVLPSSGAVE